MWSLLLLFLSISVSGGAPSEVQILGSLDDLVEGESYEIVCESSGLGPNAIITWWKAEIRMNDANQVLQEGDVSRSTLHLTLSLEDNGVLLLCRGESPLVTSDAKEDSRMLNVQYSPRLSAAPGISLTLRDVKEGDDFYFECRSDANPKVNKIQWYHNGDQLHQNLRAGVLLSNLSLVLQKVNRHSSGNYACAADNIIGHGKSNAVHLSVKYAPVCSPGQKIIYGTDPFQQVNISCTVESNPESRYFRWTFNTSYEFMDLHSSSYKTIDDGISQLSFTPGPQMDYGTLMCLGVNEVGMQRKPCVFQVVPAAVPGPVSNCSVGNRTSRKASIRCQPGWDGGKEQTFLLQAQALKRNEKIDSPTMLTKSSSDPEFFLTELEPGTEYVLTIMSVNEKGQSDATRMVIFTLNDDPESGTMGLTPDFLVLLGVSASIVSLVVILGFFV